MKKVILCIIICATFMLSAQIALATDQGTDTSNHEITISQDNNIFNVNEMLNVKGTSNESYEIIYFWVPNNAEEIMITINDNIIDSYEKEENQLSCNITTLGIKKEDAVEIKITYNIQKCTSFTKKVLRNTSSINIKFNEKLVFTGSYLKTDANIYLKLPEQIKTQEQDNTVYLAIIGILSILVLILFFYSFKGKNKVKTKEIAGLSDELLKTKKNLLMSILKEIEKKHRAKQISDDTYHKLKDKYKQDAVETMKQMEDIESKVQ